MVLKLINVYYLHSSFTTYKEEQKIDINKYMKEFF